MLLAALKDHSWFWHAFVTFDARFFVNLIINAIVIFFLPSILHFRTFLRTLQNRAQDRFSSSSSFILRDVATAILPRWVERGELS